MQVYFVDIYRVAQIFLQCCLGAGRLGGYEAQEKALALFLIERNFAQDVNVTDAAAQQVRLVNDEIGIQWLYSFLSADKRKTYCLYEAPNAEAIRAAARRLDVPADAIIAVSEVRPEQFGGSVATTG